MAKAYWVATYRTISNPQALAAYGELAGPALKAAGGRVLARGMPSATLDGGYMGRTVVVEYDSVEAALAAYNSPAYQEALKLLGDVAKERDIRIIEAV
ncbi:hypothetical protein ASD45_08135 [Pseudolabrys sp. Root1462]|uniref:DUF1330 domain-containing protein n=1 Tax=Pseudolabrys sp. Root1462 TaxID=1736466 RepID=UPI000703B785|nr:DUF1330 domain-containing protein [Pseudolabrys sp. Root1462]KQZ00827.1 hypothetical protein ASD45_08135 [Pseudolabrys sp. Root1462]